MSNLPTPPPGANQTVLELIYAIRGIAQALDYMHQDLRRTLDENARDVEKLLKIVGENQRAVGVLPITVNDRIEKLLEKLDKNTDKRIDHVLDSVRTNLNDVRTKLYNYLKAKEQEEELELQRTREELIHRDDDFTGKVEIIKDHDGDHLVNVSFRTQWITTLRKMWPVIKWAGGIIAALGGVHAIIEIVKQVLLHKAGH